ncbi:MAG: cytochrome c [Fuerstiella sp.]
MAVALVTVVGCSDAGFDSDFVSSPATTGLIEEAQEKTGPDNDAGVVTLVDQRFGDPQKLTAWSKLPVDFGGVIGTVVAAPDAKSLQLDFDGQLDSFLGGNKVVQFVTGPATLETVTLQSWSAETGIGELVGMMIKSPSAGDQVIVDGGHTLQAGRGLYMRHCSHCHGTSGDGAGPTAEYLYPRPRDYRPGKFKFTSTKSLMRPARNDLHRILKNGIPGTYMPSFVPMLDKDELHAVVEYVRFLSMRGEFEQKVTNAFASDYSQAELEKRLDDGEKRTAIIDELKGYYAEYVAEDLKYDEDDLASAWEIADAEESLVIPSIPRVPDSIESRRRGRAFFVGTKFNCVNCHGIGAKGDGPQTLDYELVNNKPRDLPGLHDDWGHVVRPRNLTRGIYRGGRRPIDIFRRVYSGINGAKMPGFGGKEPDEELWHIVNYVLSIPFNPEPGHIPGVAQPAAADGAAAPSL